MENYNNADLDYVRIPMQLRFARDDMFEDLIAPARADRSLSTLILQLLQAYYRDETVRDIVTRMSMGISELDILNKQVDRVMKSQNNANIMAAVMQGNINNMRDDFNSGFCGSSNPYANPNTNNPMGGGGVEVALQQIMLQLNTLSNEVGNIKQQQQQQQGFVQSMPQNNQYYATNIQNGNIPAPAPAPQPAPQPAPVQSKPQPPVDTMFEIEEEDDISNTKKTPAHKQPATDVSNTPLNKLMSSMEKF